MNRWQVETSALPVSLKWSCGRYAIHLAPGNARGRFTDAMAGAAFCDP